MTLTADRMPPQTDPTDFIGWQAHGIYLQEQGKFEEAVAAFQRCVELKPHAVSAWSNLALGYRGLDQYHDALSAVIHATRLDPNWHVGWINLSTLCGLMGLYEQAVEAAERATDLAPQHASTWGVLGNSLRYEGMIDACIAAYDTGLALQPNQPSLQWNRAEALLLKGDWTHGWAEYEWRHRRPGYTPRWWGQRLWRGERITGTLLLHAEQGFGDAIQFARFAKQARSRAGRVVIRCHPRLMPLLSQIEGVDTVVSNKEEAPSFDKQHYLMSVPHLMRLRTFERSPYLRGELGTVPDVIASTPTNELRIGVGWQGNPDFGRDHLRSIPLQRLAPLAKQKNVTLFSLQKGDGVGQIAKCGFPMVDLGSHLDGGPGAFVDTIEAMRALDLVITSDTALAHVAGAAGVEVWVLLPYAPDWRWGLERADSDWYASMRLFRQPDPLDWAGVVEQVCGALTVRQFRKRWGGERAALDVDRPGGSGMRT